MRAAWLLLALLIARPALAYDGGRYGSVTLVEPDGPARAIVILFAGSADREAADAIAEAGALVVEVDPEAYLARLDALGEACHELDFDAETLSRKLERERNFATYLTPIIAGRGLGGALARLTLAEAPPATIAGALAVSPTDAVRGTAPICLDPAPHASPTGWIYAPREPLPGFYETGSDLAALVLAHLPDPADGLPLIALPAPHPADLVALVLSGDGGWRDIDKNIAESLQRDGVSVVGLDSLRYFWTRKSPEDVAHALEAVLEQNPAKHVALIGYSFGADVLPFAYNRLPARLKSRIVLVSLLGFAKSADFEITLTGWLGAPPSDRALPVAPELAKIPPALVQCFYGEDEEDTACPSLPAGADIVKTPGGHHFDGDYAALAKRILDGFRRRAGEK
jgi:type IV secretory pathway VirJ component